MNLPLTFSLDQHRVLDTLEAVLAIARRGGVRLDHLLLSGHDVALGLSADDPDLLDLFRARLDNLIGVHDIMPSAALTAPAPPLQRPISQ